MQTGDLTEANLVKTTDYSGISGILVHILASITGLIVSLIFYLFVSSLPRTDSQIMPIVVFSFLAIIFLVLGSLFGFVWNTIGWKLGISLVSIPLILFGLALFSSLMIGDFSTLVKLLLDCLMLVAAGYFGPKLGANYKEKLQRK
jgi:apolipoprotein N-acyltransferase